MTPHIPYGSLEPQEEEMNLNKERITPRPAPPAAFGGAAVLKRFTSKVDRRGDAECWPWLAGFNGNGYGRVYIEGQMFYAHRVSYELFRGEIPAGLVIDHLCKNRACTNPAHLEVVTQGENARRGSTKEMCIRGHPLKDAPIVQEKRRCAECERFRKRIHYEDAHWPEVDLTAHAIDRASLYCRDKWHEERVKNGLGIHSWLVKVATEALAKGEKKEDGKIVWKGMKFAFQTETRWPILLTVRPDKERRKP